MNELALAIVARLVLGREVGELSCTCQYFGLLHAGGDNA